MQQLQNQNHSQQQLNPLGLILQRYKKIKLIKRSKRKQIWLIENISQGQRCVVKLQDPSHAFSFQKQKKGSSTQRTVLHQANFLHAMQGHLGFPFMIWSGQQNQRQLLLVEELGQSIQSIFINQCNSKFSLKTVLMIGKQLLELIQDYHSMGYVHRRLLPRNLNLGKLSKNHKIYLNDLFDSKKYTSQKTNKHLQPKKNSKLSHHLSPFTTLNQLQCGQSSRRDDVQAILLIMIYFLKGGLPWDNVVSYKSSSKKESPTSGNNQHKMEELKLAIKLTSLKNLCKDLPNEFISMFKVTRNLQFTQQPNYLFYYQCFQKIMYRQNWRYDYIYDWILFKRNKTINDVNIQNLNKNKNKNSNSKQNQIKNFKKKRSFKFNLSSQQQIQTQQGNKQYHQINKHQQGNHQDSYKNSTQQFPKCQRDIIKKYQILPILPTIKYDDQIQLLQEYYYPFQQDVDVDQVTRRFNNRRLAQDDLVFSDYSGQNSHGNYNSNNGNVMDDNKYKVQKKDGVTGKAKGKQCIIM